MVRVPRLPGPGEVVQAHTLTSPGGHPVNVSVDLRGLGFHGRICVSSAVGPDPWGAYLAEELGSVGVTFVPLVVPLETGRTVVIVEDGLDRRFLTFHGANEALSRDWTLKLLESENPDLLYLAMGLVGEVDTAAPELLDRARELGAVTVLDFSLSGGKRKEIASAVKHADVVHCNVDELLSLSGESELLKAAKLRGNSTALFVTDGSRGAHLFVGDRHLAQGPFQVEEANPTGAGDAFTAGLIFRLLVDRRALSDLDQQAASLTFAQAVGAAKVTKLRSSGVTMEEVNKVLEAQGESVMSTLIVERIRDS
ncbi:fructokinase [Sulfodiicoccus acidiphilus]|uniref:Fructokinase n=1 Tax=Sulfodiicoccus acidiphilus TaxID=1670455 RepID=A0A348B518_9CREN|nr:fructokinase [Sulfodiicoccus acidiphilus]GGT89473.1 fructokinase [Sulfodiicoccus acidiphilus]